MIRSDDWVRKGATRARVKEDKHREEYGRRIRSEEKDGLARQSEAKQKWVGESGYIKARE